MFSVADGTRVLEIALRSICSSNNPHIFMPTHTAVATAMAVSHLFFYQTFL